eukprot:6024034-Lingulodinium_polyedra.AAC.1
MTSSQSGALLGNGEGTLADNMEITKTEAEVPNNDDDDATESPSDPEVLTNLERSWYAKAAKPLSKTQKRRERKRRHHMRGDKVSGSEVMCLSLNAQAKRRRTNRRARTLWEIVHGSDTELPEGLQPLTCKPDPGPCKRA